jgi:hypothetical protein
MLNGDVANNKTQDMPISYGIPYECRNRDNNQIKFQNIIFKAYRNPERKGRGFCPISNSKM